MSRIGKQPIAVPSGVTVNADAGMFRVKGPKGELTVPYNPALSITQEDGQLLVTRPSDRQEHRALHGLTRSLINNMVVGVTDGYEKKLEIHGTGYRVANQSGSLVFSLGYSHQITVDAPEGIAFAVENPTRFSVQGIDKQRVGETSAKIRKLRKPDPYKGKGVRYAGEQVRRKVGKSGK